MFTAGLPKYLHGWLDPSTQAAQGYFIKKYYSTADLALLAPMLKNIESKLFWESIDYLAVLFELGFLVAVFKPALFRVFIFLALCFHLLNGLMLDVFFIGNNVVYLLFLNKSVFRKAQYFIERYLKDFFKYRNLVIFSIIGIAIHFYLPFHFPFGELLIIPSVLKILLAYLTTEGEMLTALLISFIGIVLGIFGAWFYIKERKKSFSGKSKEPKNST